MDVIYLSSMFDSETYNKIFTEARKPLHAANKYHRLLCKGLAENGANVLALSVLPANSSNCRKRLIGGGSNKTHGFCQRYLPFLNFPVLKQISLFFGAFFSVLFAKRGAPLIYDVLMLSPAAGALLAAKLSGRKILGIATDLPQFMPISKSKVGLKLNLFLMDKADGYIFLTRQMNLVANKKGKPFAVIEGQVDSELIRKEHLPFKEEPKKILYAGAIAKAEGIDTLCKAFTRCDFKGAELHIFGDGDFADELKLIAEQNPNIIYHGNCPNEMVVEQEFSCHLLVNPRPTAGEFTKYSFPSKLLEYMASGTPVLSSRLAGIPEEYAPFVYYFDAADPESLEAAMKSILSKPAAELEIFGAAAKSFALKEKSNIEQSRKILKFISDNLK